jgi:hypothetical protein
MIGGLVIGTVAITYAGPFTRREARQQARIHQGIRNGEITPCESRYLGREQARIEAHRQMAWSDGTLSPWEARRLTREQNRAGRHIWEAKHNAADIW